MNLPPIQFSLRTLLLTVTLFGFGIAIAYKWPWREVTNEREVIPEVRKSYQRVSGRADLNSFRTSTTWQRKWGAGRWRHGTQTLTDMPGSAYRWQVTWRRNVLHGPYKQWQQWPVSEDLICTGTFHDGVKEGIWSYYDDQGRVTHNYRIQHGQRAGDSEFTDAAGNRRVLSFANDRVVKIDGRPLNNIAEQFAKRDALSPAIQMALEQNGDLSLANVERKHFMRRLRDFSKTPIYFSPEVDDVTYINEVWHDLTLGEALAVIAQPRGLVCDVRYGGICITTPEDLQSWTDPTGISNVHPSIGSLAAWRNGLRVDSDGEPLLNIIRGGHGIGIGTDTQFLRPQWSDPSSIPVYASFDHAPLRDALGILLYQTRCRCHLEDDKLVFFPPKPMSSQRETANSRLPP